MMFTRPIGQAEVGRIAALDDPVFRNLWITTAYHDLAQGMARLFGELDVSWSTFATWASKTAGLSIRKDVLGQLVNATLSRSAVADRVATRISLDGHPGLSHLDIAAGVSGAIDDAIAAVSRHIAEGNLKVFQELGPLFARTVAAFVAGPATDTARRDGLLASIAAVDGDAEAGASLRTAFAAYCAAMVEPDRRVRAERIFLANALIGLVEQTRLQPDIEDALNVLFQESFTAWLDHTLNRTVRLRPMRHVFEAAFAALLPEIEHAWRAAVTEHLMTLITPTGHLNLGRDVPSPGGGRPLFPADLASPLDPAVVDLLFRYDRTGGTGIGSGARDWADVADRMGYIVNLFRSRQQDASLLGTAPFSDAQWTVMQAGHVPPGQL